MFSSKEIKNVTDAHRLYEFKHRLETIGLADYASLLSEIETALPVLDTAADFPAFGVLPTVFDPPSEWPNLLSNYPFDNAVLERLLNAGFIPLDRESSAFGITGDPFPDSIQGRYLLLDPDYSSVLLPYDGGQVGNRILAQLTLQRYLPHYPILEREKSAIFSLGAIRGHLGYYNALRGNYFEPIDVTLSSRAELDDLVAGIRDNLISRPYFTLWFRGQVREFITSDLTADASRGICPWRSYRDPSLTPSLCRRLVELWGSWYEYAAFLLEFGRYALFLEQALDIPPFDIRSIVDSPQERLGSEFLGVGDKLEGVYDTGVVHDYHPTYRGLQKLFFFQHYGLPSSVLDITHDLDVALFFANHRVKDGRYISVGNDPARILYIIILHAGVDQFLDSRQISEHYEMLRPLRQKCGLISGASMINRNLYARFVSIRVHLDGDIEQAELDPSYLFPDPEEDAFLHRLLAYQKEHKLNRIQPFILATG